MAANRKMLNSFLVREAAKPALAMEAMDYLELLLRLTNSGRGYVLAPLSTLDGRKVAGAVALASGRQVRRLRPVSLARPFTNPAGLGAAEYADQLQPLVWEALRRSLGTRLDETLTPQLNEIFSRLGEARWLRLWESLHTALWHELWNDLRRNLSVGIEDSLTVGLHDGLRDSLLAFLGHAITGDAAGMNRFKDLMMLLPKALPLGEMKDEPGCWLILGA